MIMTHVFELYGLKAGVSIQDYRRFSLSVDQPAVLSQPGVRSFKVYEITGSEKGKLPYQILEHVEVESWESWQKALSNDEFKKKVDDAARKVIDTSTVLTVYGEELSG